MTKDELKEQDIRLNRLCFDYHEKEKRITELEKETKELKALHESDKRSLRLIAEKGAKLENKLKAEKEYNATLRKEIDEYTNSHTLCTKYKQLEEENERLKAYNEKLLNGDIEKHNKIVELEKGCMQLTEAIEILKKYRDECPAKYSFEDIDDMAEQFLKECE